ncbi:MAG TPA: urate hydroxylase PuuD, partial [Chloroflexota bacterium]
MLAYALEWANLLVRWLHVTAAIAWIGTSFYYIALDFHLLDPRTPASEQAGIAGEVWEIHGGGFYRVEKYRVAPAALPNPLHWFKWEAYTTWLSGFGLLIVLYYANAGTYLVDRNVADISPLAAVV